MNFYVIVAFSIFMNAIMSEAFCQNMRWLNGGKGDYLHYQIFDGTDTTGLVCGQNVSLGLKFWTFNIVARLCSRQRQL
jgi:hypothetical protein